jgi:hypothetical protein
VKNLVGNLLNPSVSMVELKQMDLKDLYVQYVVAGVKANNEIFEYKKINK